MCFDQYTEGLAILKEKEDKKLREAEEKQKREEWESLRYLFRESVAYAID